MWPCVLSWFDVEANCGGQRVDGMKAAGACISLLFLLRFSSCTLLRVWKVGGVS